VQDTNAKTQQDKLLQTTWHMPSAGLMMLL